MRNTSIRLIITLLITTFSLLSLAPYIDVGAETNSGIVYVVDFEATIDSGLYDILSRTILHASKDTVAIILVVNTNGGYLVATEAIVDEVINSKIPIYVFVPPGGRAFSAGAYIGVASYRLVMAPGSVIGSAEPRSVGGTGTDPKIVNAMAEWMESLAMVRGRNASACRLMVTENRDYDAAEAVELGVADYSAASLADLMEAEGFKDAEVVEVKKDIRASILSVLSDPFILGILLDLAALLILIEVIHPTYVGGIAAGVAFILALLSLGLISVNTTALILLLLGIASIILELKVGHGGPAVVGGILIALGVMLLYTREYFIWTFNYTALVAGGLLIIVMLTGIAGFYLHKIREVLKRKTSPLNMDVLVGKTGIAKSRIVPGEPGVVMVMSDYWTAYSDEVIEEGEEIVVVAVDGLKLRVVRKRV